ncbi:MAG: hypothetical protein IJM09_03095 [Neisseriaceae bacterium]|nr:hypothetical protein [Neisseriaceae bacterium]
MAIQLMTQSLTQSRKALQRQRKNNFRLPEKLNATHLKRLRRLFCLSAKLDCHDFFCEKISQ